MSETEIQPNLRALEEYVSQIQNGEGDLEDIRIKKKQLSAIQRTIRQLEKNNIPIPESISSEKLNLVSEINDMENASNGCLQVYNNLVKILFDLGRLCNKLPHKDLYRLSRQWRSQATPRSTLRKQILTALREYGGSARETQIFESIEKQYGNHFTPADLSRPGGKNLRWQNNVRRERRAMIEEGILTNDSKGKTWTLAK